MIDYLHQNRYFNKLHAAIRKPRAVLILGGIFWVLVLGVGIFQLLNYANTPGERNAAPIQWPIQSRINLAPERATLVMLAHPHCPCTRASIRELELVMTRCQGLVATRVLFYKPREFPDDWARTDIWKSAEAIPGVTVMEDLDGEEARLFGAITSGHTVLYNAAGRLLLSGGITSSRGHSGSNAGRDAIIYFLTDAAPTNQQVETPVFGCSVVDPNSRCAQGMEEWKH